MREGKRKAVGRGGESAGRRGMNGGRKAGRIGEDEREEDGELR